MDYIEQERSEVDAMTPAEIDYNFEKMEQFVQMKRHLLMGISRNFWIGGNRGKTSSVFPDGEK